MSCTIQQFASRTIVATTIALGLAAAGCSGPVDDESSASVDQFTGTWEYESGTVKFTCNSDTRNAELSGNMTISESASADLLMTGEDCNWDFDVSGDTADVVPGQECETENNDGTTTTSKPTQWTIEVDGNSMTETFSGIATVETSRDDVDCDVEGSGSLVKRGE